MKEVIKIISVLTIVCLVCGFLLSFVYSGASEKIESNTKKAISDAIANLAPFAENIEEIKLGEKIAYKLFDKTGNLTGYAFIAEGQGYQGKIKMLAVIDINLEILEGIEIIESIETPGLGARIQEEFFRKQFQSLSVLPQITYTKDIPENSNQIKAITGATVSSKAVVNILNKRIKELSTHF
ncbi:MAG: FMN-binding protein [Candidatus Omnitrophica bacterium]|nr:FMN-binding protein [Candidatus Omnitrophota bacterium]